MTSVMRPDPRYELALASQVPHIQTEHPDTSAVAVTLLLMIVREKVRNYGLQLCKVLTSQLMEHSL